MLRRTVVVLSLILCILAVGTTAAYSAGYPVAALGSINDSAISTNSIDIIVLGKFDSGPSGFTAQEAENVSQTVMSLAGQLFPTSGFTIITPNQLSAAQLGDADYDKTLVANNYAAAGMELFAYLDIKKAPAVSQSAGQNIRIDLYISVPPAGSVSGITDMYIASLETALSYVNLLGSLFPAP